MTVPGEAGARRRHRARAAVTEILAHETRVDAVLEGILDAVCAALDWEAGAFWREVGPGGTLRCVHLRLPEAARFAAFRQASLDLALRPGDPLPGWVWETRRPVWLPDVVAEASFARRDVAAAAGLRSGFACPVLAGDACLGALEFVTCRVEEPDDDLLEMMGTFGTQLGQFIVRREAEERRRISEEELGDFFENAPIGIHWLGPDGRVLRINRAELAVLGYERDEMMGRPFTDFHVDPELGRTLLRRLRAGEVIQGEEARLRCKDGSVRYVLLDSNVRWEDGRFVHTRCFARDVTASRERERALRFLAEASRSLSTLVDAPSALQRVADLAVGDFADWCTVDLLEQGEAFRRVAAAHADPDRAHLLQGLLRRYPPLPGGPHGVSRVMRTGNPEIRSTLDDAHLRALARDEAHLDLLRRLGMRSYLSVPLRLDGRVIGALTFIGAESGRRYGVQDLALVEDLARRVGIALENARLYQELRENDRRKDEFLAMLAHELRNPLAPIRSGLDLLMLEGDSGQRETVSLLLEHVDHVVRLVDDLLDVSRIMRGKVALRRERVEVSRVLERAVASVRAMTESRRQELVVRGPSDAPWLRADPARLVQVLGNLLHNASKYTEEGGRIEVRVEPAPGAVTIAVEDTGIGIDPHFLPNVFDLFAQADRALDRSEGGLGIGLTLARNLTELHGGTLTAWSAGPGKGSTFTLRLPVSQEPSEVGTGDRRPSTPPGGRALPSTLRSEAAAPARKLRHDLKGVAHVLELVRRMLVEDGLGRLQAGELASALEKEIATLRRIADRLGDVLRKDPSGR